MRDIERQKGLIWTDDYANQEDAPLYDSDWEETIPLALSESTVSWVAGRIDGEFCHYQQTYRRWMPARVHKPLCRYLINVHAMALWKVIREDLGPIENWDYFLTKVAEELSGADYVALMRLKYQGPPGVLDGTWD